MKLLHIDLSFTLSPLQLVSALVLCSGTVFLSTSWARWALRTLLAGYCPLLGHLLLNKHLKRFNRFQQLNLNAEPLIY